MKALFRWLLLYCICLAIPFLAHSAFGQSPSSITTDAEFTLPEPKLLNNNLALQSGISTIKPYFVMELGSELVKKLTLIKPDSAMAELNQSYISVREATFVRQEFFSDPRIIEPPLEYCQTGLGYDSMEDLETSLLTQAKQLSVHDLLNQQITSIIELASCEPSRNDVAALLTDSIQILETPEYYNGREFAEVCITISPYVEEESSSPLDLESIADEVCKEP